MLYLAILFICWCLLGTAFCFNLFDDFDRPNKINWKLMLILSLSGPVVWFLSLLIGCFVLFDKFVEKFDVNINDLLDKIRNWMIK